MRRGRKKKVNPNSEQGYELALKLYAQGKYPLLEILTKSKIELDSFREWLTTEAGATKLSSARVLMAMAVMEEGFFKLREIAALTGRASAWKSTFNAGIVLARAYHREMWADTSDVSSGKPLIINTNLSLTQGMPGNADDGGLVLDLDNTLSELALEAPKSE